MWFQRDQFTNKQIPFSDCEMIQTQHNLRLSNHPFSARSKASSATVAPSAELEVGDLVYLFADRDKSHARDRYLVTSVDGSWCNVRKFVGSQLRNASYRLKRSECFKVPCYPEQSMPMSHQQSSPSDTQEVYITSHDPSPPLPPVVPPVLSTPLVPSVLPGESHSTPISTSSHAHAEPQSTSHEIAVSRADSTPTPPIGNVNSEVIPPLLTQRRSCRQRRPPDHLKDFILN